MRIQITNKGSFEPIRDNTKPMNTVRIHSKLEQFVRNIFAKLGICSKVVTYISGNKIYYINLTSINKYLKNHDISEIDKNSEKLADKINDALTKR